MSALGLIRDDFQSAAPRIDFSELSDEELIRWVPLSSDAVVEYLTRRLDQRSERHLPGQHDQKTHGHGGGGGGGSVELSAHDAKELHGRLETPDGGFTVNPRTGEDVKSGYAVAIYPQRSFDARVEDVTPNDLQRYVEKNADLLADDKNMFGGWHDPESGRVWLDVSRVESSKEAAIKLAKQHNQIAIFDLGSGNSIDTGGTGQA